MNVDRDFSRFFFQELCDGAWLSLALYPLSSSS